MNHLLSIAAFGLICAFALAGVALADGGRNAGSGFGSSSAGGSSGGSTPIDETVERARQALMLRFLDQSDSAVDDAGTTIRRIGMVSAGNSVIIDIALHEVSIVARGDGSSFAEALGFDFNLAAGNGRGASQIGNVFRSSDDSLLIAMQPVRFSSLDLDNLFVADGSNLAEVERSGVTTLDSGQINRIIGGLEELESLETLSRPRPDIGNRSVATGTLIEDDYADSKLPFLGDIPILKRAFVGQAHLTEKRNLLILLTPSVIIASEQE